MESSWKIVYDRFRPAQEGLRESLCTLGNGYFATRGASTESSASRIHYPGTYIAGVYNKLQTDISGRTVFNDDIVNCPNWLLLTFKINDGEWFTPKKTNIIKYAQELDMREGVLSRKIVVRDREGRRTRINSSRIVHMAQPHIMAIKYTIIPENYNGVVTVRSAIDGGVQNTGIERYRQLASKHLDPCEGKYFGDNGMGLTVKTNQSKIKIAIASKIGIFNAGKKLEYEIHKTGYGKKTISQECVFPVKKKKRYQVEKICSVYTSKDKGSNDPMGAAVSKVKNASRFDILEKTHKKAWDRLWEDFSIDIRGDNFSQIAIRLHTFHLLQTASFHNKKIDTGLPARGLHGESYRGHIFWDELFVMHFYDYFAPEISKSLLKYRFKRLPQARKSAREAGYDGAMFPWQSSSTGEEETQVFHLNPLSGKWAADLSKNQRHISIAIAYNVFKHWERTEDKDFLYNFGAEILLSTAKFWSSLVKYNRKDGRYHTHGIMGPDEFHERNPRTKKPGLTDNAYTNVMIVWTLLKAMDIIGILPSGHYKRISMKVGLKKEDIDLWADITKKMKLIINEEGIISQFEGYFDLEELDWKAYSEKYDNIKRMDRILKAEGKTSDDYKVAKQADVLMIFYLLGIHEIKSIFKMLGYKFTKNMLANNYGYYINRTSHGSTLSMVVHCYIAYIIGHKKNKWGLFQEVLKSDIYDTQRGTTSEGIHAGVMGGSIDIVFRGFAGISSNGEVLSIYPNMPEKFKSLKVNFKYRGNIVNFAIGRGSIKIHLQKKKRSDSFQLFDVCGKIVKIWSGQTKIVKWKGK